MKVCCILNDKSGSASQVDQHSLAQLFGKHTVLVDFLKIEAGTSIKEFVCRAIDNQCDVIVAGGGDGTINSVAAALIGRSSIKLGVLPLGTLNHFARDLGIPTDISQAVDIICAGHSKAIDVGLVNDNYFLNNSSVGLYPAMVKLRETLQRVGYSKWWAALLSSFRILGRFRRFDLEVQPSKGPFIKRRTPLLFVGNNAYETTVAKLGSRIALDRGLLWVNMPTSSTRMGFFMGLLALVLRREKPQDTVIFEATSLKVISRKRLLTVATDGEVLRLKPPLNYSILPGALNVIVPGPEA